MYKDGERSYSGYYDELSYYCPYQYRVDTFTYPYYYCGPGDYYMEADKGSYTSIALFSLVSILMQIAGLTVYLKSIKDKTDGTNYKGMLYATELTWGMTSMSGLFAYFR